MVALGSLKAAVAREKPGSSIQINENTPIGTHILKRRLELGMLQRELAKAIGVCEDTITGWENGRSVPQIRNMPAIATFLGYVPLEASYGSFENRIRRYRLLKGLSCRALGAILGVDGTTVSSWENGEVNSSAEAYENLQAIIAQESTV